MYSAPSSPPSSPAPYIDSSPASSPSLDVFIQDSDLTEPSTFQLSHPFAASAKANRPPPQYEKKRMTPPLTLPSEGPAKKPRRTYQQDEPMYHCQTPVDEDFAGAVPPPTPDDLEAAIWDEASTKVVDDGHGAVTLDNQNLTYIPQTFISDLAKFYIPPWSIEIINKPTNQLAPAGRPLARVSTTPAGDGVLGARLFPRTRSAANVGFGLPREELQLYMSSNKISTLPLELMTLRNLSVLAIRNNKLTYIPPEIIQLTNLHTLNIANNKISFLPAEILQMSLTHLQVHPNPFLEPDAHRWPFLHSSTVSSSNLWAKEVSRRPVSDTKHTLPRITPLVELALRAVLSPVSTPSSDETVLEAFYELPLDECTSDLARSPTTGKQHFPYPIPSYLRTILDVCIPGSVYLEEDGYLVPFALACDKVPNVTGIGVCPSPKHRHSSEGESVKKHIFVRHAEERLSWEQVVAGVSVGGLVPVQWRGCQWNCLDFLSEEDEQKSGKETESIESRGYLDVEPGADGGNSGDDVEMEAYAVQVLEFNSGPGTFGDDGFDD